MHLAQLARTIDSVRSLTRCGCSAALLGVLFTSSSNAQELSQHVSLSAYLPGDACADVPSVCEGVTAVSLGVIEFAVYPPSPGDWGHSDSLRFSLDWPAWWSAESWDLCQGELVSGDPTVPGADLLLALGCDADEARPVLRVTIDCTSHGTFWLRPWGDREHVESYRCAGGGRDARWIEGVRERWVTVGAYCGPLSLPDPCEMHCIAYPSATFEFDTLLVTVPRMGTVRDTINVRGSTTVAPCGDGSLCGGGIYSAACFEGIGYSPSWATVTHLDSETSYRHRYVVEVEAGDRGPGIYDGELRAYTGCSIRCYSSCVHIRMVVESATPTRSASWGEIKSLVR